jgi:hypothetical protein
MSSSALAQGLRDHLGAPALWAEEPRQQIGGARSAAQGARAALEVIQEAGC